MSHYDNSTLEINANQKFRRASSRKKISTFFALKKKTKFQALFWLDLIRKGKISKPPQEKNIF